MLRDQSLAFFSCDLSKILGVMLGKFLYLSQEENGLPSGLAFHQSWSIRGEHLPSEVVTYRRWWVCVFARVMKWTCPMGSYSLSRQAGLEALTLTSESLQLESLWKASWFSNGCAPSVKWCLSWMAVLWTRLLYLQSVSCDVWSYCHASCSASNSPFKMLSKIRYSRHFFTTQARESIFQAEEIQTCGTGEKTQSIKYFSCNQENPDLGFLEPR